MTSVFVSSMISVFVIVLVKMPLRIFVLIITLTLIFLIVIIMIMILIVFQTKARKIQQKRMVRPTATSENQSAGNQPEMNMMLEILTVPYI